MPKVSVVIPAYNGADHLAEAVESILAQTCQDFEVIVVDDGSTDSTRQVLKPYLGRITYLYQENQGESVARNNGVQSAGGEYIAFLDADDLWLPDKLARQMAVLQASPEAILSYSPSYIIDATGERISFNGSAIMGKGEAGPQRVFSQLVMDNFVGNPGTVVVRRHALMRAGGFDPAIRWGEDWDLWLRLALQGPFVFVPEPLACYRVLETGRRLRIEASDEFVRQNEIILDKAFAALPESQGQLAQLRPAAFAALYLRSAMHNFELADMDRGARYVELARRVDPDFGRDRRTFARRVAGEGFRIANSGDNLDEGRAFVELVFDHLPPSARGLRAGGPRALAELYMAAAFTRFERGDRAGALKAAIEAIGAYPPSAGNRGLLSISVQALLGGKPWAKLRDEGQGDLRA